jgi:hypothetical protein
MGRGRQKAKQTKVARQLKYFSPATDYNALQRELGASPAEGYEAYSDDALEEGAEEEDDESDQDEESDGYEEWASGHGR